MTTMGVVLVINSGLVGLVNQRIDDLGKRIDQRFDDLGVSPKKETK